MKKWIIAAGALVFVLAAGVIFYCCHGRAAREAGNQGPVLYRLNAEETTLVEVPYDGDTDNSEEAVESMLAALAREQEDEDTRPAIPEGVEVQNYVLEDEKLCLNFNSAYQEMDTVREVLCRAALVRSLTGIDGVEMVAVQVDGVFLQNKEGREYGFQQTEDFVQNTGSSINSYEETTLTLYFANESGRALTAEKETVRYHTSQSREQLVIEQLMKGPGVSGHKAVIPADARLLSVSVRDGVCYVNFDEGFNSLVEGVTPEVMVYAIVNSVTESTSTGQVQITVDGETPQVFQASVEMGEPLTSNLDILEESNQN